MNIGTFRRFMLSRLPRVSTPLRLGATHTSLQFPLSVLRNSVQSEARTGTPAEMLVDGKKPQKLTGVTQEQMSRIEREMANLQGPYKLVEQRPMPRTCSIWCWQEAIWPSCWTTNRSSVSSSSGGRRSWNSSRSSSRRLHWINERNPSVPKFVVLPAWAICGSLTIRMH